MQLVARPNGTLPDGFVVRLESSARGLRVAVKDLIDVVGVPTTGGSAALADAAPALTDAPAVAAARAGGAAIIGKTALHELARGSSGINPWSGTPRNPLDPTRVPGGSSSGSAVAVAVGAADVALGTDTAGSIRIPAACCGVVGLKPTHGRLPAAGVLPLAPSLDVVGPLARTVRELERAMVELDRTWCVVSQPPRRVGRLRPGGSTTDPQIDAAVDQALERAGFDVSDVLVPDWQAACEAAVVVLRREGWEAHRHLLRHADRLGAGIAERIARGCAVNDSAYRAALVEAARWRARVRALFDQVDVLAVPTLPAFPPRLDAPSEQHPSTWLTLPANLAGIPALALPVRTGNPIPASIQLLGPPGSDELVVAAGQAMEDPGAVSMQLS